MATYDRYTRIASLPKTTTGRRQLNIHNIDRPNQALNEAIELLTRGMIATGGIILAGTVTFDADSIAVQNRLGVSKDGRVLLRVANQTLNLPSVGGGFPDGNHQVVISALPLTVADTFTDAATSEAIIDVNAVDMGRLELAPGNVLPDGAAPVAIVTKSGTSWSLANLVNTPVLYRSSAAGVIVGKVEIQRPIGVTPAAQAWHEVHGLGQAAVSLYRISTDGVGRAVAVGVIHNTDNPELAIMNEALTGFRGIRVASLRIGNTAPSMITSSGISNEAFIPRLPPSKIDPGAASVGHIYTVTAAGQATFVAPPSSSGGTAGVSSLNGRTGAITLAAGTGISISLNTSTETLTISSTVSTTSVDWANVTNKPATFAPSAHSHDWADVANKPATFAPSAHGHDWADIANKPVAYPPSAHNHDWASIANKPATFTPSAHSHDWASIASKPTTFAPAPHAHVITDVTNLNTELTARVLKAGDIMTGKLTISRTDGVANDASIAGSHIELRQADVDNTNTQITFHRPGKFANCLGTVTWESSGDLAVFNTSAIPTAFRAGAYRVAPPPVNGVYPAAITVIGTDGNITSEARIPALPAAKITSGVFDIARLPVVASGASSTTQVVRADDSRLSNARAPTPHAHTIADTIDLQAALDTKTSFAYVREATSFLFNFTTPTAVFKIGNFSGDRVYTLPAGNDLLGGTVTLEVSTAAAPNTYSAAASPVTVPAGGRLRVTVTGSTATASDPGMITLRRTG